MLTSKFKEFSYGEKCPFFATANGNLFFDQFLIKKSLRRYYKSMYLPFNIDGINTPIIKNQKYFD